jgi:bacterioferritin
MNESTTKNLNSVVSDELHAVMQYMYFHFLLEDMAYKPLASLFRRVAIQEMEHVEDAAERILFLDGDVEMAVRAKVEQIHDVKGMLVKSRDLETQAIADYNRYAKEAAAAGDEMTRSLLRNLIRDEESHFDLFDDQVSHIEQFGDTYLALQVHQEDPGAEVKED